MTIELNSHTLPRIVVSAREAERLTALGNAALQRWPDMADSLLRELERADVVPDPLMPPNVVRMNSIVEFETDGGQKRKVQLVFPPEADIGAGKISVLTPIGTALIGLSPGQSMTWSGNDGREHRLNVLTVGTPERA
jgi:regulator of nucleoside diphosphate kinase